MRSSACLPSVWLRCLHCDKLPQRQCPACPCDRATSTSLHVWPDRISPPLSFQPSPNRHIRHRANRMSSESGSKQGPIIYIGIHAALSALCQLAGIALGRCAVSAPCSPASPLPWSRPASSNRASSVSEHPPSLCDPARLRDGLKTSQVPMMRFHACIGSWTPRSSASPHHDGLEDVAFDPVDSLGTPVANDFGAQWPRLHVPLPTLRDSPHGRPRTARGRGGGWPFLSLDFHHGTIIS